MRLVLGWFNGELVNSCLVPVFHAQAAKSGPSKGLLCPKGICIRCNRLFSSAAVPNAAFVRRVWYGSVHLLRRNPSPAVERYAKASQETSAADRL